MNKPMQNTPYLGRSMHKSQSSKNLDCGCLKNICTCDPNRFWAPYCCGKCPLLNKPSTNWREEFKKVSNFTLIKENKCEFCDYTCKTMGWRNGVIQHMLKNHKDKYKIVSKQQAQETFISSLLQSQLDRVEKEIKERVKPLDGMLKFKEIKIVEIEKQGFSEWDFNAGYDIALKDIKAVIDEVRKGI